MRLWKRVSLSASSACEGELCHSVYTGPGSLSPTPQPGQACVEPPFAKRALWTLGLQNSLRKHLLPSYVLPSNNQVQVFSPLIAMCTSGMFQLTGISKKLGRTECCSGPSLAALLLLSCMLAWVLAHVVWGRAVWVWTGVGRLGEVNEGLLWRWYICLIPTIGLLLRGLSGHVTAFITLISH